MNPYSQLPNSSFWRPSVADKNMFDIDGLWNPKFELSTDAAVATFGSCFAQHIGKSLKEKGYKWLITEPAPTGMPLEKKSIFNYEVFTCRTGNIYTTSLLKQWVEWALELKKVPEEYWVKNNKYFDPFRPNIEPDGFSSKEEMIYSQRQSINSFKKAILDSKYFVFTMGLTESWFNKNHGYEYPMCPGTVAGTFDNELHEFKNQQFGFIQKNLREAISYMKSVNPKLRFILTVSPVPLTATYSNDHVLVATVHSKSILRAVAGQVSSTSGSIDYFPSYEIINSPVYKGTFFEPNQRNVNKNGVKFVMSHFFNNLNDKFGDKSNVADRIIKEEKLKLKVKNNEICEEELLEAFRNKK
jgi:hypothetical protein